MQIVKIQPDLFGLKQEADCAECDYRFLCYTRTRRFCPISFVRIEVVSGIDSISIYPGFDFTPEELDVMGRIGVDFVKLLEREQNGKGISG